MGVTPHDLWHRYLPESGNWQDGTFTRWIVALSAAPTHQRAPVKRIFSPQTRTYLLLAGLNPCAEFVRPGLFVPLFFLFVWLAVPSAPRTHRDIRSLSAFQKIDQYPASLSGLTGPVVANHSCVSSWQGRMRRRTIEPAVIVRTRYYLRTSNLLLFLSGTLSLPYGTLVTFFRFIARPRPRLVLSGEDLVVMGRGCHFVHWL
jgi:hypothetical protein